MPASAWADPPACPDAAPAYTGSDAVVSAITDQRTDERAACLAVVGRLDRAHDDAVAATTAAHDDADRAHTDAGNVQTHVDAVTAAVGAIPTPAAADSYTGPTAGQLDDGLSALHGDLWLALGVGAALVFGVPFIRLASPWLRAG